MGNLGNQLKHVIRGLVRSPLFTIVTLITIGLGIGANAAIFSVINGILLKPLPYADPGTLVGLWQSAPALGLNDLQLSPSDYFTFYEENRTFQHMGMWNSGGDTITGLAPGPRSLPTDTGDEDSAARLRPSDGGSW